MNVLQIILGLFSKPDDDPLKDRIKQHEGFRLEPYTDSEGFLTVGYGRNLESTPFTRAEVDLMFETDFRRAKQGAENFHYFESLNPARQGVLIEMVFQMGPRGVGKFTKFAQACDDGDWKEASRQMLDSQWAKQTPDRARELADIFERGK